MCNSLQLLAGSFTRCPELGPKSVLVPVFHLDGHAGNTVWGTSPMGKTSRSPEPPASPVQS